MLDNGLTVLMHRDPLSTMTAVNVVYKVGSRNEEPNKTGLAHLFEHLMFEGNQYDGDHFDEILQQAGGENNAYTNADITSYYITVPTPNIEIALYLEAGRMSDLSISDQDIETQRNVVIEEFKETCLNVPYGDAWHHILELSYPNHTYGWPVIGLNIEQLKSISTEDFRDFYKKHYVPNNAILSIAGNIDYQDTLDMVKKWFGKKAKSQSPEKIKLKNINSSAKTITLHKKVPVDSLWITFNMCDRIDPDYYSIDIISDVLGTGKSSRLYESLVKQKKLALSVDAYVTGTMGPGLFIIEAKPANGVTLQDLEDAIWIELELLKKNGCSQDELNKLVNRIESGIRFSEIDALNKAMHLAYFEILGDINQINREIDNYTSIKPRQIIDIANKLLMIENSNTIKYNSMKN